MGALLESGLVGNIGLKHLKVIKEDTINKWDKLGFLDGLKGHLKENVAQLYENQASFLINEATSEGSNGAFETVVFPIVRRVFSKLLANDIVSVQAMNLPIGKLFYFVPNIQGYSGTEHRAPVGSPNNPSGAPGAGYNYNTDKSLYDRFYEGNEPALDPPGLFDYSKGQYSAITASVATVAWSGSELIGSGYSAGEYRKALIVMSGFANGGAGKLIGPDGNPMDNESFLSDLQVNAVTGVAGGAFSGAGSGDLLFRVVTQKYGKGIVQYGSQTTSVFPDDKTGGGTYDNICDANGYIYLEVDLQVPCTVGSNSLDGYSGLTTTIGGAASVNSQFTANYRIYKNLLI